MLKSAQKCSKVLKSAQLKIAKHFSKKCLVQKMLSTFQRSLYMFNVCVKSSLKVLETFCPKTSERRKIYLNVSEQAKCL